MKKASTVLRQAGKVLAKAERWRKGDAAVDSKGEQVSSKSKAAVGFCALGAINRYSSNTFGASDYDEAEEALTATIRSKRFKGDVIGFNDAKSTKHSQIVAWFNRALNYQFKKEAAR